MQLRSTKGSGTLLFALGIVSAMGVAALVSQAQLANTQKRQIRNLNSVEGFYTAEIVAVSMLESKRGNDFVEISSSPVSLVSNVATRTSGATVQKYVKLDAVTGAASHCAEVTLPRESRPHVTCLVAYAPTGELRINGSTSSVTVSAGDTVTLDWTSRNATNCTVVRSPPGTADCAVPNTPCGQFSAAGLVSPALVVATDFTLSCNGFTAAPYIQTVHVTVTSPSPPASPSVSPSPGPCNAFSYLGSCWRQANGIISCDSVCSSYGGTRGVSLNRDQCLTIMQNVFPTFIVTGEQAGGLGNNCGQYLCSRTSSCFTYPVGGPKVICGGRSLPRPDCNTYPPGIGDYSYAGPGLFTTGSFDKKACPCVR